MNRRRRWISAAVELDFDFTLGCTVFDVEFLGRCAGVATGQNVPVDLVGGTGASQPGGITVTFTEVSSTGMLRLAESDNGAWPASAFVVTGPGLTPSQSHFWYVRTSASYTGPVEFCAHYDPSWFGASFPEANLQLLHACSDSTSFCNIRTGLNMAANRICGEVDSLAAAVSAGAAEGETCASADACSSGFCVDGVCCESACGGGASGDCRACAVTAGAPADGTCSLLPSSHVCRPSAGILRRRRVVHRQLRRVPDQCIRSHVHGLPARSRLV